MRLPDRVRENTFTPCANAAISLRFVTTVEHYTERRLRRCPQNVNAPRARHVGPPHSEKQPMQKFALPLAACLLALAATGAQAQTPWKWRDASGQLHISDTAPPAGTPAKNIISGPPNMAVLAPQLSPVVPGAPASAAASASAAAPAKPASAPETALDKRKKAAEQERADKEKADREALEAKNAAIRKDNCARAKASLAGLQSGQRIARLTASGEREILDDAGRAAEIKHTQEVVASNCGAQ